MTRGTQASKKCTLCIALEIMCADRSQSIFSIWDKHKTKQIF